jgi:hypothetical protein
MDSSSSSDTTGVGGNRCFRDLYLAVDGAARTVPLPRPARLLGAVVRPSASSDMRCSPGTFESIPKDYQAKGKPLESDVFASQS